MTVAEIIEQIKRLPPEQQREVAEFVRSVSATGRLNPDQLGTLAQRMAETPDAAEAQRLQQEIVRGFYGEEAHA